MVAFLESGLGNEGWWWQKWQRLKLEVVLLLLLLALLLLIQVQRQYRARVLIVCLVQLLSIALAALFDFAPVLR